jgi:hypothetical protein
VARNRHSGTGDLEEESGFWVVAAICDGHCGVVCDYGTFFVSLPGEKGCGINISSYFELVGSFKVALAICKGCVANFEGCILNVQSSSLNFRVQTRF